jgi:D-glycero-D-manno-heptose 1,7-bisphosphate phosphatase
MGVGSLRRAVFLDRDGVLIATHIEDGVTRPPASIDDVLVLAGVPAALDRLRRAGFLLVVVTNQPDVARGTQTRAGVEAINRWLDDQFCFDAIRVCYHDNADGCACRKPRPGMLLDAASELGIDISASVMVGDRETDIAAGKAAGCKTIFIGDFLGTAADFVAPSLILAIDWLLALDDARGPS